MSRQNSFAIVIIVCTILVCALPTWAQQKGQYFSGQYGLNAGVLPDPGFTYANLTINYSADTLKDQNGHTRPLTGSYDIWAVENIFYYVPKFKILGATFAPMIAAPTPANGSLTLASLDHPNIATSGSTGWGVADIWVQPVTLGWSLKRADVFAGYAFQAPTGRYTPGASDNVGSGYWGNNILANATLYLSKDKGTSVNLATDWEVHGSKTTSFGTKATPGQAFSMEWALGQVLPLKKDFSKLLQLGVVGYDQWQVSADGGLISSSPIVQANRIPYYSFHAVGFQANYILPAKNLSLFFKFYDEYRALATAQGYTTVFGGSWTLRIPKPSPAPAPPTP